VDLHRALFPGQILRGGGSGFRIYWKLLLVLTTSIAMVAQAGSSSLELSGVDYPDRAGDPPNPRLRGEGAAARRRNVLVAVLGIGVHKDRLVFLSLFWTVL
jgi:hypothetical protein